MLTISSPTRVTLALDIIRRVNDGPARGYHELGIVKHQITLADTLRVELLRGGGGDIVECDDPRVPCDGSNICVKVCNLVREKIGGGDYLRIGISKKIPVMGGLAGGSANAAAMLRGLDALWNLNLTQDEFRGLGRRLGMDVPFFHSGGTAFDTEATGIIRPVSTNLKLHIILAIPDFGVSTKEAYGGIDYPRVGKNTAATESMMKGFEQNDRDTVLACMHNDFELSVFDRYPRLRKIRDEMLQAGCRAAAMSGSGSTVIGIADNKKQAEKISSRLSCQTIITESFK